MQSVACCVAANPAAKAQVAPSTFLLSDGKMWNASKLRVIPRDSFQNAALSSTSKELIYSYSSLDLCGSQSPGAPTLQGSTPSFQPDSDSSEISYNEGSESVVPRGTLGSQQDPVRVPLSLNLNPGEGESEGDYKVFKDDRTWSHFNKFY
ncbi:hypothetical protein MRX96_010941 [Rhipicephalus microplus]